MATFRIREASSLLGVSTDTLRRWADDERIDTITDDSGRLAVDGAALANNTGAVVGCDVNRPQRAWTGRTTLRHKGPA